MKSVLLSESVMFYNTGPGTYNINILRQQTISYHNELDCLSLSVTSTLVWYLRCIRLPLEWGPQSPLDLLSFYSKPKQNKLVRFENTVRKYAVSKWYSSTKTRQAGHTNEQSLYSLVSMGFTLSKVIRCPRYCLHLSKNSISYYFLC